MNIASFFSFNVALSVTLVLPVAYSSLPGEGTNHSATGQATSGQNQLFQPSIFPTKTFRPDTILFTSIKFSERLKGNKFAGLLWMSGSYLKIYQRAIMALHSLKHIQFFIDSCSTPYVVTELNVSTLTATLSLCITRWNIIKHLLHLTSPKAFIQR